MSSFTKIIAGTAIGASMIAGFGYIKQLRKAKAELEIIPKPNLYALTWSGITIRVDVVLKNPTAGSFYIKFPFIKLIYKDSTIGSSQAIDKNIKIKAFGEAVIDKILITVPVTNVFSLGFSLVKALHNKEPIKLKIKTMTMVDIGFAKLPYEVETEFLIKK